jgi:hypothetical protein
MLRSARALATAPTAAAPVSANGGGSRSTSRPAAPDRLVLPADSRGIDSAHAG